MAISGDPANNRRTRLSFARSPAATDRQNVRGSRPGQDRGQSSKRKPTPTNSAGSRVGELSEKIAAIVGRIPRRGTRRPTHPESFLPLQSGRRNRGHAAPAGVRQEPRNILADLFMYKTEVLQPAPGLNWMRSRSVCGVRVHAG